MQIWDNQVASPRGDARIWIVDRSRLFLEGMLLLLAGSNLSVTLEAVSVEEMDARAAGHDPPEVLLIGINVPLADHGDDVVSLEQICARFKGTSVVVLSDVLSIEQLKMAMKAGASGFLLRSISAAALKHSLALAIAGEKVLPSEFVAMLVEDKSSGNGSRLVEGARLSSRERAILRCIAHGSSNKQIANELHIAEGTVKVHVKAVFKKVGARNRTDAAVWALHNVPEVSD
jgi:two-component system nitrate/nitrite response regulator NarL